MAIPQDVNNTETTKEENRLMTVDSPRYDEESQPPTILCPWIYNERGQGQRGAKRESLRCVSVTQTTKARKPRRVLRPFMEAQPEEDILSTEGEDENRITQAESTSGHRYQANSETIVWAEDGNMENHATAQTDQSSLWRDSTSGKEHVGERVKKRNRAPGWSMVLACLVFVAFPPATSSEEILYLQQGAPGSITFDAAWNISEAVYFTVRMGNKDEPFCSRSDLHPQGFKSPDQHSRFRVAYTLENFILHVTVNISNVTRNDADLYILTLPSMGAKYKQEARVRRPLGKALCQIEGAVNGYSSIYAFASCQAIADIGNVSLACFQNGVKIPFQGRIQSYDHRVKGRFWVRLDHCVYCCSHCDNAPVDQGTCRDFTWPEEQCKTESSEKSTTENNSVTASGWSFHKNAVYISITITGFFFTFVNNYMHAEVLVD